MKKIKTTLFAVGAMLIMWACSNEDNLHDIFVGREWELALITEGETRTSPEGKEYVMTFRESTFTLTTPSGAKIQGNWQADGNSHSFVCSNINTSGNINSDAIASRMLYILQNATHYNGDTNWLQIIVQSGNIYMQFHNK